MQENCIYPIITTFCLKAMHSLEHVEMFRYLDVLLPHDLSLGEHVQSICSKARTFTCSFASAKIFGCCSGNIEFTQDVQEQLKELRDDWHKIWYELAVDMLRK